MKILTGKRQMELEPDELARRIGGRCPIHIDVGTGTGKLVLRHAGKNPDGFYIGMDPSAEGMHESAVKAAKRGRKAGTDNLLFVVGSIESTPDALAGIADKISVILPWGTLRDGIAKAASPVLDGLRRLGKPGAALEILIGYDGNSEPCEMERRALPPLSREHFRALAPAYQSAGVAIRQITTVGNNELKAVESDWAKKLAYGTPRTLYRLDCVYIG